MVKESSMSYAILKPVKIDKHGPAYTVGDVKEAMKKLIVAENYFLGSSKVTLTDTEKAIENTERVNKQFNHALDNYLSIIGKVKDEAKNVSGAVRESSEKLAQGLARIEKAANFDRLERYVTLLERAATAMNTLAQLEAEGKLEKIAGALK
jgi:methyl-accepting chemotaxis protein